jgi:hypothetical protein
MPRSPPARRRRLRRLSGADEAISDCGAIALFHTGQTGVGSKLEIRDEIRPKLLKANARKLLNI